MISSATVRRVSDYAIKSLSVSSLDEIQRKHEPSVILFDVVLNRRRLAVRKIS